MRDANNANFSNLLMWYSQAGTPIVKVSSKYNVEAGTFSLKFRQEVPPTPGRPDKEPMFIHVAVGLLDSNGHDMPLSSVYHDGKLGSVPSNGQPVHTTVLRVTKEFIAEAITLPGEGEIMDMMKVVDPDAVNSVRSFIGKQLASELREELLNTVKNNRSSEQYEFGHLNMSRRALKNTALVYLVSLEDQELTELALHKYRTATNMTDQFSALAAIAKNAGKTRDDVLANFYNK